MEARALVAAVAATLLLTHPLFGQPEAAESHVGATVLCYHIVEAPQDPRMEVSRETFRQHLQYIEMTGYNVIPLRHLYEYVSGKRSTLPRNPVVITLDDGWRSAYTEAYPELKKRNFPFTLFIYPNIIGKTAIALSWDQIREMSNNGGDIQSHSLSHPFLTKRMHRSFDDVQYAAWLSRELAESKKIIEKNTGKKVQFLAYPYGDYDTRVAMYADKAGYSAALTCDFGKVRKGSDPLRMKRFVIDKRMDFAAFRRFLGATPMQIAEMTPPPGRPVDVPQSSVVSARIPNHKSLDPTSVGMALLSLGNIAPYSYDPSTGQISMILDEAIGNLKGRHHRAVVWATEARTGKRVEATWTFSLPSDEALPSPVDSITGQPAAASTVPTLQRLGARGGIEEPAPRRTAPR